MRSILFDTDPGVDDALALIYLARHPEVDLVGITTVCGNATIETTTRNALHLVERFGLDAPVARGAGASLDGVELIAPDFIHGANGLGDIPIVPEPSRALDPRPAHQFIIDTVRAHPGEITLLAVARLTNLARAIIEDPGIVPLVKSVVIMGGAFGIDGHYGNASPVAEANILGDPRAADLVCTAAWPVTLIGLDVTEKVIMTPEYLAGLRDAGGVDGQFIWDVTRVYEDFHANQDHIRGIFCHDQAAAVCVLDESAFTFRENPVRVLTEGIAIGMTLQRGPAAQGEPAAWDGVPAQRVAVGVDAPRLLDQFAAPFLTPVPTP
jgi:inosine-uridine nucleoside N-ribohydrolase